MIEKINNTTMILRKGSNSEEVKYIQQALIVRGAKIVVDGVYGTSTENAVKEFQKANNLVVDGIVGDKTYKLLSQKTTITKSSRKITSIILHCSATKEGEYHSIEEINNWH